MTNYALISGDSIHQYPYSLGDLRRDNPSVSFPVQMTDGELAEWNVLPVVSQEPIYDPLTQNATEGQPINIDGIWTQTWNITQATPEEIEQRRLNNADYFAFWDALLISPVYQEIRSQALSTPGVLVACTEFIAAISDAKAGRANVPAIQACINNLLSAGTFTPEDLQVIGELLVIGNLQDLFTLG